MLNNLLLVGRLVDEPKVIEEEGKKTTIITLAVGRSYKNSEGIYEADFIKCVLWNAIAESTAEYCHKGDLIGIKGRLENHNDNMTVVADKVTYLLTNNNKGDEN